MTAPAISSTGRNTNYTGRYVMRCGNPFLSVTGRTEWIIGDMGKHAKTTFRRRKADRYFTPPEAVVPLLSHLGDMRGYIEPCQGEGHLIRALKDAIDPLLLWGSDVEHDATEYQYEIVKYATEETYFITNPPWTREILHPIIENLSRQLPTWLLIDADWMHTKQAIPYLKRCRKIVSVGRVSWMQNGTSSMDDCCWYLFDRDECETEFISR